jgi:hypothetical protein
LGQNNKNISPNSCKKVVKKLSKSCQTFRQTQKKLTKKKTIFFEN